MIFPNLTVSQTAYMKTLAANAYVEKMAAGKSSKFKKASPKGVQPHQSSPP